MTSSATNDGHLLSSIASMYPRDDVVFTEIFRVINNFGSEARPGCRSWISGLGAVMCKFMATTRTGRLGDYSKNVINQIQTFIGRSNGREFVIANADVLMSVYRKWYPIYKRLNPKS